MWIRKCILLTAGFGLSGCLMALLHWGQLFVPKTDVDTVQVFAAVQPAEMAQTQVQTLCLPAAVPDTVLQAVRFSSYEGPFVEDGSDRNVFGTAALEVKNTGTAMLKHASIRLTGEQEYVFELTYLPPGATVLVLEKQGKRCGTPEFTAISGEQSVFYGSILPMLCVSDLKMGSTMITNRSKETLNHVILYYKNSMESIYIGGVTYTCAIGALDAGQSICVNLPHYAMGYSRIVAAIQEKPRMHSIRG